MIRTFKRSKGVVYQVYGRAGGRQVYVSTHTSRRDAERAEKHFDAASRSAADLVAQAKADAARAALIPTAEAIGGTSDEGWSLFALLSEMRRGMRGNP